MKTKIVSTMNYADAPDAIGAEELARIWGISVNKAREYFQKKDFPKIDGFFKADKEVVRLYMQGIKIKEKPKESLLCMILLEIKKLNEKQAS